MFLRSRYLYMQHTRLYHMVYTTVLSYQMMIEEKLYAAMINAEQRSHFYIACGYGRALAEFILLDDIPPAPVGASTAQEIQEAWMKYYFVLLQAIIKKENEIIKDVRVRYNKGSKDLPVNK